jgi:hypothetical protein
MTDDPDRPLLQVVNSDATPEEIAALVAVFASLGGGSEDKPKPRSAWAHPRWGHRVPHGAGPAGWRTRGLPR